MRELAFLNKGINISLYDNTSTKKKEFVNKFDGGILEFVKYINQKKPILQEGLLLKILPLFQQQ